MDSSHFDAALNHWRELPVAGQCSGLLLGNGASRAIWRDFAYDSLFERAQKVRNRPLSQTDLALFKSMGTQSFEQVLGALNTTVRVNAALAVSASGPLNRYYAIKEALIHAMRSVHIPWRLVKETTLQQINAELRRYSTIYTTNYDLLSHWAVWHAPDGFDDMLDVDQGFDASAASPAAANHRIFYLHGGLHLVKNRDGTTRRRAAAASELLDGFAINVPGDTPLFINEGPSEEKLRSIRSSDYLSRCLHELAQRQGPLCVFGHQLGENDAHIVRAVQSAKVGHVAVAIFPLSDAWICSQKAHYTQVLGEFADVTFFDATTHPLGAPGLNVPVEKQGPGWRSRA